jgi:hypothetical protein
MSLREIIHVLETYKLQHDHKRGTLVATGAIKLSL